MQAESSKLFMDNTTQMELKSSKLKFHKLSLQNSISFAQIFM